MSGGPLAYLQRGTKPMAARSTSSDVELDHAQDILETARMEHSGPGLGAALHSSMPTFVAQPDSELAARQSDRGPEPVLLRASPSGTLTRIWPLAIIGLPESTRGR